MQAIEPQAQAVRLGVVGGGQLALMLGEAAREMGLAGFTVLDPTPGCPAARVASGQIIGSFTDAAAIRMLAEDNDLITIEIEQVNATILAELELAGKPVHPSANSIALIQDKLHQKEFLQRHGLAVVPFRPIENAADLRLAGSEFGYPLVLKARTQGYDGRGNVVVDTPEAIDAALDHLQGRPLYVEQYLAFAKELAVMVARSTAGELAAYPVVETEHRRNICHVVIAPAVVDLATAAKAKALALSAIQVFQSAGIFGVELFMTADGELSINEIAPRPHNSGHYTIEGCLTSQFSQHLRAILGLPLGETALRAPWAVMVNILGEDHEPHPAAPHGIAEAEQLGAAVHIYGKHITSFDRKMGHLTVLGSDLGETLQRAYAARKAISI